MSNFDDSTMPDEDADQFVYESYPSDEDFEHPIRFCGGKYKGKIGLLDTSKLPMRSKVGVWVAKIGGGYKSTNVKKENVRRSYRNEDLKPEDGLLLLFLENEIIEDLINDLAIELGNINLDPSTMVEGVKNVLFELWMAAYLKNLKKHKTRRVPVFHG